jgi:cation transport protein ChaC
MAAQQPLFIFGYGSLMWNPDFEFERNWVFELQGFSRSPSVYSWKYRGTPENPGLVLGLDRGGSCTGILFQVAPQNYESVYQKVLFRERGQRLPHEQVWTPIYDEHWFEFSLDSGEAGKALTFVCNPESPQYAGRLSETEKISLLARSRGQNGTSLEYFEQLLKQLESLDIQDEGIRKLYQEALKTL